MPVSALTPNDENSFPEQLKSHNLATKTFIFLILRGGFTKWRILTKQITNLSQLPIEFIMKTLENLTKKSQQQK
jgi:hypothetical protein